MQNFNWATLGTWGLSRGAQLLVWVAHIMVLYSSFKMRAKPVNKYVTMSNDTIKEKQTSFHIKNPVFKAF
jgi:hypothetical protein